MTGMPAHTKYERGYFLPPEPCYDWVRRDHIERAPIWCSVDLRDGNQALVIPMSLEEKLEFFKLLVEIGFKQIEIGFPAASETEYELCRTLIEKDMIPADVTIQVLTQAREHIIRRTFEALEGCETPVIVHVYNSTSAAQREQVFRKSRDEVKQIAVEGAKLLKQLTDEAGHGNFRFEYSPESFTGTEPEYALEVCNAVLDVWRPTTARKAIVNLPAVPAQAPEVPRCDRAQPAPAQRPRHGRGLRRTRRAGRRRPRGRHALRQRRAHGQRGCRHRGDEHVRPRRRP